MRFVFRILLSFMLFSSLATPGLAAQSGNNAAVSQEALQQYVAELIAAPEATNTREVQNKVDELESDVEGLKAIRNSVAPASPAAEPVPDQAPAVSGKTTLAIEPGKEQSTIKMQPAEKKAKVPSFIGNWYFKDIVGEKSSPLGPVIMHLQA